MENRAEFRLGKLIFLGILGNLGSRIDPRDLNKKTRASGLSGHVKRGKAVREREEMSPFLGNPRILFIVRLVCLGTRGVRSYAVRTRTSCMTEASTALARMGRRVGRVGASDGSDGSVPSDSGDVDDPKPLISVRGAYEGTQGVLRSNPMTPLRILPGIYN